MIQMNLFTKHKHLDLENELMVTREKGWWEAGGNRLGVWD